MLLRARENVSQVAQKAARALDDVTKAQGRSTDAASRATAPLRQQISTLEQLIAQHVREKKALDDSSRSLRSTATARRQAANEIRRQLEELQRQARVERATAAEREKRDIEEVRRLRLQIAERNASAAERTQAFNRETQQMRQQAALLEAQNRQNAASNQRRAAELGVQIAQIQQTSRERARAAGVAETAARTEERSYARASNAVDRHGKTLSRLRNQLSETENSLNRAGNATGPFTRFMERIGISTGGARSGLRGLNAELQGFQLAIVIKYAQALISALISLAAQFVAVAAAAGQAAIGIGAALAAGAAQAVPVVGVLVAAFSRLTSVLKIVKLQNQQQLTATHDAARAAKAQTSATDQIRSAEQRVAEAHRNTARAVTDLSRARSDAAREEQQAQRSVTQARKDAIRTVQDLMAAEEDAAQSLLQAQQSRQQAIETGDVMGAVQGDIDVSRARRDVGRAREDAAPVRARGVEGVDAVQQAEQRLADTRRSGARQIEQAEERLGDARRSERQATDDLSRTRRQAADNLAQETAAADKLADSLAQLSPAERQLYRRIIALQETYRRIARPITDIITRAFTGVVDRVNQLLQDPRIIRGFRNIAIQIAGSIRTATREAGGPRSVSAFQILSAEAARNIPIATRILVNFFRAARNLVLDALPAFRLLLGYIEDYSGRAVDASRNSKGISDFFKTGVEYAKSFFDLGLAVINLLLTIAGPGGAAGEGNRTIQDLTKTIEDLTDKARDNAGSIRHFFRRTHDVFFDILDVLGNIGSVMIDVFDSDAVSTFADFLNQVILPALGNTVKIMGAMVTAFHSVFSVPLIGQVAQMAATVLLLFQGLTVVQGAISGILGIVPKFLRAMGLMATAQEVAFGAAVFTPLGWAIGIIAAITAAVYLLDRQLHFLGPTWRWIKRAAGDALEWIKNAAEDVVSWFSDVWTQGLLYWIRYPFVWLAKNVSFPILRWIVNAAEDVIAWLKRHFGRGGDFAIIGDLITAPFRAARGVIRLAFHVIKTIIIGALDLIAGRFDKFGDDMGDFWATFVDIGRGAISSMLGIVGDLLGALGHIKGIGGPFRDAAKDVHAAQQKMDDLRDSTKKHRDEQRKANDAVKDAAPVLLTLRRRYEAADDRVRKLRPGTDAYKDAVVRARKAHRDYNEKLRDTANRSKDAQGPTRRLKRNIDNLGDTSSDTADQIAGDLNSVLKEIGAKEINVRVRRARRRSNAQNLVDSDNPLLGSPFGRYGGGMASPYGGSSRDDHVLVAPGGRAVAALSGTEGIVNAPQMGIIDSALSFTRQMTGMPWGSLHDLWGSGMRHFQGGGGLHPAIRNLSNRLDRMFGLQTTSTTGGRHATNSLHYRGLAADISGAPEAMARATRYIRTSGIWRSLLQGIHNPGLSVSNGRMVPPSFWGARTWADHRDHLHLAASSAINAIGAMVTQIRAPRFTGLGNNVPSRIARRSARVLTRAANRYLQRQMDRMGGTDPTNFDDVGSGSGAALMRSISRSRHWNFADWWKLDAGETSHGRNLANPTSSARLRGQFLSSNYGRYGPGSDPRRHPSMDQQIRSMAQYIAERYGNPTRAYRSWLGRSPHWYAGGGLLGGASPRRMQTGGPLAGAARAAPRLPRIPAAVHRSVAPIINQINEIFTGVAYNLGRVARGLSRSKGLTGRLQKAFARITGEGQLLDQMRAQTELITARAARALQRRQFAIWRRGPTRLAITDAEVAQGELRGLQEQRGGLNREGTGIQRSIRQAERALAVARRRRDTRARDAARAALNNLRTRQDANTTALAQNAQDQVEAQERFQQALVTAVNDAADRRNAAIERATRLATALGHRVDPNDALDQQMRNMRRQIAALRPVLARARRTGNTTLANQVADQIADLNVQIAEAVAQQFQNAIDAVNNTATRQGAQLDRWTRLAQLGGQTNFDAMGFILGQRQQSLTSQRDSLSVLRDQAFREGNIEQYDNLVDQIDELNTSIAENTQAIQDNTDAAFNFVTQQINDAAGFSQGLFSGAQGFFQALSEATGIDTLPQQLTLLQGIATSLNTQGRGLAGQLASLLGDNTVLGLSGADLVNYLVSISSGPIFDAITANMDPTQKSAFQDLINSLIGNATATVQNTQAIQNLTGSNAQSFSSTLWTTFRRAIFTGSGGLLPQYQTAVPTAAVGAHVTRSGMMIVHAGENVRPAGITRDWQGGGGDSYELNVTTPTEVLDPTDVARQLAFYRKSQGRR